MRSKSQQLMNEISAYVDRYYSDRHMVIGDELLLQTVCLDSTDAIII